MSLVLKCAAAVSLVPAVCYGAVVVGLWSSMVTLSPSVLICSYVALMLLGLMSDNIVVKLFGVGLGLAGLILYFQGWTALYPAVPMISMIMAGICGALSLVGALMLVCAAAICDDSGEGGMTMRSGTAGPMPASQMYTPDLGAAARRGERAHFLASEEMPSRTIAMGGASALGGRQRFGETQPFQTSRQWGSGGSQLFSGVNSRRGGSGDDVEVPITFLGPSSRWGAGEF